MSNRDGYIESEQAIVTLNLKVAIWLRLSYPDMLMIQLKDGLKTPPLSE